jgi:hypothetical protein
MGEASTLSTTARTLASLLEPVVGQVYFAPECHSAYAELGFDPSPGAPGGVAMPDGPAYFTSRGSVMGQVPGEVVAAAFGVFNPKAVVPSVAKGWSLTDATTICAARDDGATAQLKRLLGDEPDGVERATELLERAVEPLRPEGRALFAGVRSLGLPDDPVTRVWRLGDQLREYRGDAHISAWTAAGFDATEISLATELYWGLPMRTYSRTRAWSDADFDAATARLVARGVLDEAGATFTPEGAALREDVEVQTDLQMAPVIGALGDDAAELFAILEPWGVAVRDGKGYPAAGPHDLARAASR